MGSTLTRLVFHVVFSTKNREPFITNSVRDELYRYIGGVVTQEGGVLLEIGGIADHVHLLLTLKPSQTLSNLMQKIKGNSSKWVNETSKLSVHFGWQEGYGAFSVSASQVETVQNYIKNQETHHRRISFKDEFVQFLEKHNIEYNERYLW